MNNKFAGNNMASGDEDVNIETRLWDYIDELSAETAVVENLIRENNEWKVKYAELLRIHQLVAKTELEQPSLRFTKNVMDEIARYQIAPAAKKYINTKIIWGIAAFFITIIVGFLAYGLSQIDWSAGNASSPLGVDFTAVDYTRMFNNSIVNVFVMVNILLGLLLLDRYLNSKRKEFMA